MEGRLLILVTLKGVGFPFGLVFFVMYFTLSHIHTYISEEQGRRASEQTRNIMHRSLTSFLGGEGGALFLATDSIVRSDITHFTP